MCRPVGDLQGLELEAKFANCSDVPEEKEKGRVATSRDDEDEGLIKDHEEAHTVAPLGGPWQPPFLELVGVQEDTDRFLGARGEGSRHALAKPRKHGVHCILHSEVFHLVICELLNPRVPRALELHLERKVGFQ